MPADRSFCSIDDFGLQRSCECSPSIARDMRAVAIIDGGVMLTCCRLIVIPLSFLRRLDSLKYTSVIALVSIGYLVVLVVYHFASGDTIADRGEVHWLKWQGIVPTLASFPVIVFAYTCHQNVSLSAFRPMI